MANYTLAQLKDEYSKKWAAMSITRPQTINNAADKVIAGKSVYTKIESQTGVPWYFIGIIHLRESDCDFNTHLHNGDPLTARTRLVPKGRPIRGKPPFTFEESAIDALQFEGFDKIKTWSIEQMAFCFEQYNGWGYRFKHTPSAYLWSGSNQYTSGKFIADHVFDPNVKDVQVGTMCVLKVVLEKDQIKAPAPIYTINGQKANTDSDDEEENKDYAEPDIPRPTTAQMNEVSRKHWWSDWLQWAGLGGLFGTGTYKAGDVSGIATLQPALTTIKQLADTAGIYVIMAIMLGVAIYFMYQKKLMKDDVQNGNYTPSGGDPINQEHN